MCLNKKIETLKEKSFSKKREDAAELTNCFLYFQGLTLLRR